MNRIVFTGDWHMHDYSFPNTSNRLRRCGKAFRCLLDYVKDDNWVLLGDFFQITKPSYNLMNLLLDILRQHKRMRGISIPGNHDQVTHDFLSPLKTLSFSGKLDIKYRAELEKDNATYFDGNFVTMFPFCRKAVDFLAALKAELICIRVWRGVTEPLIIACHQYFEEIAPFVGSEVINLDDIEQVIKETGFQHKIYFVSGHYHLRSHKDFGNFSVIYPGCAIDNHFGEVGYPVGGVNLITEGKDVYFEFFDFDSMYEMAEVGRFKIRDIRSFLTYPYKPALEHYYRVDIPTETELSKVEYYKKQLQKYKAAGWHIQENFVSVKKRKKVSKNSGIKLNTDEIIKLTVKELSVPAEYDQDVLIAKGKELIE